MGILGYIIFGFISFNALFIFAIWFYFKKLNPKLQAKYQARVDAAKTETTEALKSLNLAEPLQEDMAWLDLLLARFWKSMRESDSLLTPFHEKLKARLTQLLAKIPAKFQKHVAPVQIKITLGEQLPTFTRAELLDPSSAHFRLHFSVPPNRVQAAFLVDIEVTTQIRLAFSALSHRFSDFLIPIVIRAKIQDFSGILTLSHEPLPEHKMYISFLEIPRFEWDISILVGHTHFDTILLDTFRLRSLLKNIIALKLHQKMVYPHIITSKIPMSPVLEEKTA